MARRSPGYGRPGETSSMMEAFSDLRADYAAAQPSRFRRTRTGLYGSADAHYANERKFLEMREYARDMDRNDAIVGSLLDRATDNAVQGGFIFEPDTGDETLNAEIKARVAERCDDPLLVDFAQTRTFRQMEWDVYRASLIDGDHFGVLTDEGRIQLVEADRCRTPDNTKRNVVHGVLLDEATRRRREYWFTRNVVDPLVRLQRVEDVQRVPAYDEDGNPLVLQVGRLKRVTQTRGVTAFAPVFDVTGQFDDLNFAKLVQAQLVSCFAAAIQREANGVGDTVLGERSGEINADGSGTITERVQPGMFLRLKAGEKLVGFSPNVPNAEFFDHVRLLLTLIGINLGMPLVMVLMDASETNFSGFRGAVDQARLSFRVRQRQFIEQWHSPLYRWWLRMDIAAGVFGATGKRLLVSDPRRMLRHKVEPPGWPYIEPMKDAQAAALQLKTMQTSPRRMQAQLGRKWADVVRESVEDNKLAIQQAIAAMQDTKKATGVDVPWQMFLNRDLPDGIDMLAQTQDDLDVKNNSQSGNGGQRAA